MGFAVVGLDHVQLAMPPEGEGAAEDFYAGLLGFTRIPKPEPMASRGGCWFASGPVALHLGVEVDFRPARKAHPALVVRDRGPGIAPDDLPHIFDRFYRAPAARGLPGSGLGLAIVAQVVKAEGGSIVAAIDPAGGTRMTMQLPVIEPPTDPGEDAPFIPS